MNKFIKSIITFSLKNKAFTFFMVALLAIGGFFSYRSMAIDAFPDVTNTEITIISQWPGRSAEEVERLVTLPVEIAMQPLQKKLNIRSQTMFGLSVVKIIFDDDVEDTFARNQVNNLLRSVSLPEDVDPEVQPPYGPTGEIYRYIITSKDKDSRELQTLQNWVIDRNLRGVPGVADINTFGGETKTYNINLDPRALEKYGLTSTQVYDVVNKSNINVGGDVIEKNNQAFVVRGIGLLTSVSDIENMIITTFNGNPVLVKNVARVSIGALPRFGQAGYDNKNDDVVVGIVVMRKGENPTEVLNRLKVKIDELNTHILPKGVKIKEIYDRQNLIDYCTHTISHNLVEGIVLVTVMVVLFMANWRTTVIVSIIIPLSLLFAFLCLKLKGLEANLLSLGAIDFGIIIDGAVVMVEGIFVMLTHRADQMGMSKFNKASKGGWIRKTASEMGKGIFFAQLIIITALLPIFSFEKVEGKMFSPLAFTFGFALLGSLIFTLTLVPLLCHILLKKNLRERDNPFVAFWNQWVQKAFQLTFKHKKITLIASLSVLVLTLLSFRLMGTEFLPQLNEGSLWVTANLPMSSSQEYTVKKAKQLSDEIRAFPEVKHVIFMEGRTNDGTDPNGFNFIQFQVDLKPKEEWNRSMEDIIAALDKKLKTHQGILYNYSQPISDNVAEAAAGIKANNAIKIYGKDLNKLNSYADQALAAIHHIKGIKDVGVIRNIGQPEVNVTLDRYKMAVYGVQESDAQSVLQMAIGGVAATQLYEGEMRFDVRVRYDKDYRKDMDDIGNLMVPAADGTSSVPMRQISTIEMKTGAAFIYRDEMKRYIGVKFSVRDRDLGSTIAEAQQKFKEKVKLSEGYSALWTGEFENQQRATKRLSQVIPLSILAIFILLFVMFGNIKDSLLVLANVPFALIGGILALFITHMNFGISAGVGFIALFGICIQNGVILNSEFHKNIKLGLPLVEALKEGVYTRTRPVIMTALIAIIGLFPAAISTGIGSESQKPLAIVIIGGLITSTLITLIVSPIFFWFFNKNKTKQNNSIHKLA
ncbi:CusA/CzcA family heavy metal efflux RND transporter [Elizabethkingia argentiflava]|uniref:CusA/CzcA family heavy metal efflux RND transporter n=1 Tax=Elizabethkingia argenteiflava TaxID=2681556 RepID=A0A845PTG7_9FLAO|nr:CusA/CzcA family heavy metal efflux RND transporter [Elizabethkingia argenteiflava]NAW50331.1 CusA/CzcA family heavy metal efflux RND transporter [Elizabethkingia argenteiflava]